METDNRFAQCFAYKGSSMEFSLGFKTDLLGVKTIIVPHNPFTESSANPKFSIATNVNSYTQVAQMTQYQQGWLDFSSAPLAQFGYLRVSWENSKVLSLCELFAYKDKNYVPGSTITSCLTEPDENSVAANFHSVYNRFAVADSEDSYWWDDNRDTCLFAEYQSDKINTAYQFLVIDFAVPLIITDIHVSGGLENVQLHIVDPISPAMTQTGCEIRDQLLGVNEFEVNKYPNAGIIQVFQEKHVSSKECTHASCGWGITRMLLTNEKLKDLWYCGFAIMGYPVVCPPTATQCFHAALGQLPSSETPSDMLTITTSQTSTAFNFPDKLSTHCSTTAGCSKTHTLVCFSCNLCSNTASCMNNCPAPTNPVLFTYQFQSDTISLSKYTVTITALTQSFHQGCYIQATMNGQTKQSEDYFVVKRQICDSCAQSTWVTTYVPTFTSIQIGSTGQFQLFDSFVDTASQCGNICTDPEYSVYCKDSLDASASYKLIDSNGLSGWRPSFEKSLTKMKLTVVAQSLDLHNKRQTCVLSAKHGNSGATINSTQTFDLTFTLCTTASESCPLNKWDNPPLGWVGPQNLNLYTDGNPQSTQFSYQGWSDYISQICGIRNFCGVTTYHYVSFADNTIDFVIANADVQKTDDSNLQTLMITVRTTSVLSEGAYRVKIVGRTAGTYSSNKVEWSGSFWIYIVSPCSQSYPCDYTQLIASTEVLQNMSVYLDNIEAAQPFLGFQDTVANLCNVVCTGKTYSLVYTSDSTEVPADLSLVILTSSTAQSVILQTSNHLYTGIYTVQIKCTLTQSSKQLTALGQPFQIEVIACHERSCKFTQLSAPASPDLVPASFSIGVGNIAGTTTYTNFKNTVGQACTTNPTICGIITYKLLYQNDRTKQPSFASLSEGSTTSTVSAVTTDLANLGIHNVLVEGTLVLPTSLSQQNLQASTNVFTITVDSCSPLPCMYSKILAPDAATSTLPSDIIVIANGTQALAKWDSYKDDVSVRCSSALSYSNQCGNKQYMVLKKDGTALPFDATVTWNGSQWQLTASTTNEALIGQYEVMIHASFITPTALGVDSDDKSHIFNIFVESPNPCAALNCQQNTLVISRTGYLEASDFSVDVSYTWGQTLFDRHNDTKHQQCWKQAGSTLDRTPVDSWSRPVCGYPVYQLVDATTLEPMSKTFGDGNIEVKYFQHTDYTTQFAVAARTADKSLAGQYRVKLAIKLFESSTTWQYLEEFKITVTDPCNPYDCSLTQFTPSSQRPTNIKTTVGGPYVASTQGPWDNTVNAKCRLATKICGEPNFELQLQDGSPVPFDYLVLQSQSQIQVFVKVTDLDMKGQTFQVALKGYGLGSDGQQTGLNGTSEFFEVFVGEEEAEAQVSTQIKDSPPIFTQFPRNETIILGSYNGTVQIQQYMAVVQAAQGLQQIDIELGDASSFVSAKVVDDTITFTVEKYDTLQQKSYSIKVEAVDTLGRRVTKYFGISCIKFKDEKSSYKNKDALAKNKTIEPLVAKIESISRTGLMTISYNRRVVPLTNVSWVTPKEFNVRFEQKSDEEDQTDRFKYKVIRHTPTNIYVQLSFFIPLDVSQGRQFDMVHVHFMHSLFMVEDYEGVFRDWAEGEIIQQREVDVSAIRNQSDWGNFGNQTVYYGLSTDVPKQVLDESGEQDLQKTLRYVGLALQALLWGPLGMHLIGFGNMEYVWVIFSQLQVISCISQLDLKVPINLNAVIESYSDLANLNMLPYKEIYVWLRQLTSDSENPDVNTWGNPQYDMSGDISPRVTDEEEEGRRLQEASAQISDLKSSRFFNKGSTDFVLETSAQLIVMVLILAMIGFVGIIIRYSVYHWFPTRGKQVFDWLKDRIFWCFPFRMLIQNYMCVTFAAVLNLKFQDKTDSTEQKVNRAFSYVILFFYSLGYLVFMYVFIRRNRLQLKLPEDRRRFDSIYMSVELEKKWALPLVSFSLLRKFIIIYIAVNLENVTMQICAALLIQSGLAIYILQVKPMDRPTRQLTESLNEFWICQLIILTTLLTDYVPQAALRFSIGAVIIVFIYIQICFNMIFLLMEVFNNLCKIYKIFRFHYVMRKRANSAKHHNQVVDHIDKGKERHEAYKVKVTIAKVELAVIQSEGSFPSSIEEEKSDENQVEEELVIKPKTVLERKREFDEMMERMRQEESQNPKIINQQAPMTQEQQEQLRLRMQLDNDWPVSPRQAKNLMLPAQDDEGNVNFNWQGDMSRASDWYALPKDYAVVSDDSGLEIFSQQVTPRDQEPQAKKKLLISANNKSDQMDYLNSKEHSKWKENDSSIFEKPKMPKVQKKKESSSPEWSFN